MRINKDGWMCRGLSRTALTFFIIMFSISLFLTVSPALAKFFPSVEQSSDSYHSPPPNPAPQVGVGGGSVGMGGGMASTDAAPESNAPKSQHPSDIGQPKPGNEPDERLEMLKTTAERFQNISLYIVIAISACYFILLYILCRQYIPNNLLYPLLLMLLIPVISFGILQFIYGNNAYIYLFKSLGDAPEVERHTKIAESIRAHLLYINAIPVLAALGISTILFIWNKSKTAQSKAKS